MAVYSFFQAFLPFDSVKCRFVWNCF